jgi:hypothetical protein
MQPPHHLTQLRSYILRILYARVHLDENVNPGTLSFLPRPRSAGHTVKEVLST